MKKCIFLLFGTAVVLSFAACSNSKSGQGKFTQAQLDSLANVKADSIAKANEKVNDSIIAAKAADSARIADSLAALKKNGKSKTVIVKRKSQKMAIPSNGSPTAAQQASIVKQQTQVRTPAQIEADKKAARFGDKAAQERLKQDEATQKAARFGDKAAQETLKQQEAAKKAERFKNN